MWANTIVLLNKKMCKLQSCQNYACRITGRAKKYDHSTYSFIKRIELAPSRIILCLNLLNDLTSVGKKLETHNHYIFPYLNRRVAREAVYYRTVKIWNSLDND